ncbi:MAG: hypothetical protein EOO01_31875, partial [Chitinophagaceae bacterium]
LKESIFPIWTVSSEFHPFLQYFNDNKKVLKIIGFDSQLTGVYSKTNMLDSILAFINRHSADSTKCEIDQDLLKQCIISFADNFSFPDNIRVEDFNKLCMFLKMKLSRINSKNEMVWWYSQTIDNLMALGKDYHEHKGHASDAERFKAKDSNPRDSMMAQNLIAYIRNHPDEKIVCWGAGTHFMNNPRMNAEHLELQDYKPMGLFVKQAIGEDEVFNLTFISSVGSFAAPGESIQNVPQPVPGSIEAKLDGLEMDTLLLLKNFNDPFTSSCLEYTPVLARWSKLFDAFIYLREFTPSHLNTSEVDKSNPEYETMKNNYAGGSVIDAASGLPVAYASIALHNQEYGILTDDSGRFSIPASYLGDTVEIRSVGYCTRQAVVGSSKANVILLRALSNTLNEVIIRGKDLSVKNVIKKVKAHWQSNYETKPFKQQGYNILSVKNYDTLVKSIETVNDYFAFFKNNAIGTQ